MPSARPRFLAQSLALLLFCSAAAQAATTLDPFVSSGLSAPIAISVPDDGSGRMFVAEQDGVVKVVDMASASVIATYLTINVSYGGERGLLGIAFDPNFGVNPSLPGYGDFYLAFTAPGSDPRLDTDPDQVLRRYTVADPSSNDASGASGVDVIRIGDFAGNHNGADIHFGPDGYLYYSMGDGGGGGDPSESADDIGVLLGKIMRIDVRNPAPSVTSDMCGASFRPGQAEYSIPSGNPFVGGTNGCGEIWLWGLRNPYRFSFDRNTGDLWIGDVGQGSWEEVHMIPAGQVSNRNLGWDLCEGNHYYEAPGSGADCPASTGTRAPVIEYSHGFGVVVTGGYRYRGPVSDMRGKYVYADASNSQVWFASFNGTSWVSTEFDQLPSGYGVVAFGEDSVGNLYLVDLGGDKIYKFNGDTDLIFANGFEFEPASARNSPL